MRDKDSGQVEWAVEKALRERDGNEGEQAGWFQAGSLVGPPEARYFKDFLVKWRIAPTLTAAGKEFAFAVLLTEHRSSSTIPSISFHLDL